MKEILKTVGLAILLLCVFAFIIWAVVFSLIGVFILTALWARVVCFAIWTMVVVLTSFWIFSISED